MKHYRQSNDLSLKEALEAMLKSFRLEGRVNQVKLINSWEQVMGASVANRTTEIKIIERKLYVSLSSASLRQDLFMDREKITKSLNAEAGASVIDEIIFK